MKLLSLAATIFFLPAAFATPDLKPAPNWHFVEKRLLKSGFKRDFIQRLKQSYDPEPFTEVLELNTLLFLRKSDYHGPQVNSEAVDDVREFMKSNSVALKQAHKKYAVSEEVIASLLWMESRHGKNVGTFHVPSVFIDLTQADRPEVVKYLYKAANHYTAKVTRKDQADIRSRTKKRVAWAIAELKAIQKMQKQNKEALNDFTGSFAGAFGMAQFEPSSYVEYARPQTPGQVPKLERAGDAIQSVAYYLHKNGWKDGRRKSYVRSLLRYNKSNDYAAAILKLARESTPTNALSRRTPAAKTK